MWGTQVSFKTPSHGCHCPSDCRADESREGGCPLASGKSLHGLPTSRQHLLLLPQAFQPTPSLAHSHLLPGPTTFPPSTFLSQNLLPHPSFPGQQVSLVRDTPLRLCPTPNLVTDPSCHHPTASDLSKLTTGNLHLGSLQFGIVAALHGMAPVGVNSELQPAETSLKSPFVWPCFPTPHFMDPVVLGELAL